MIRQNRAHIGQMAPMDADDQMGYPGYDPNQMAQEQQQM